MGSWSGHGAAAAAVALVSWLCFAPTGVSAIGANWGTQASHPLSPDTVVRMLRGNGFQEVKLFDAEEDTMNALKKSRLEVMVGIPNDLLYPMATSMKSAEKSGSTGTSPTSSTTASTSGI
jgi:glucan endo-1,3-beta-glucosidase 5/6